MRDALRAGSGVLVAVACAAGAQGTQRSVPPAVNATVVEATIPDLQRGMSEGDSVRST
jgi:hypothetical protein